MTRIPDAYRTRRHRAREKKLASWGIPEQQAEAEEAFKKRLDAVEWRYARREAELCDAARAFLAAEGGSSAEVSDARARLQQLLS